MARPTTAAFRFATAAGVRAAVDTARKLSGWVGGQPVAQGEQNAVLGMLSDWVEYLAAQIDGYLVDRYILYCGDGPWRPTDADSLVESAGVSLEIIRIEKNAGTDAVALRAWGPTSVGGIVTSVQVDVDDRNGTYIIDVWLRGSTSTGVAKTLQYQLTGSTTGVQSMALVSGTNDGIYGPIVTQMKITAELDYVEVGRVYFTWEPIP